VEQDEAIRKAGVLIEALPYIISFRGKIVVIKLGGAFMGDEAKVRSTLQDVVFMRSVGMKPVIVHGGGPEITKALRERGIATRFVRGHRYTDEVTLAVVREVLMHRVNSRLAQTINELGGLAEGLHAERADFIRGAKMTVHSDEGPLELGLVGEVESVDTAPILEILGRDVVPVIAPLGRTASGELLNINADPVASRIACELGAEKFVLVSDTHGVLTDKDDSGSFASTLGEREIARLVERGAIAGGMIPKVEACLNSLKGGVNKAHIIDGRVKHSLLLEIFTDKGIGTQIVHEDAS